MSIRLHCFFNLGLKRRVWNALCTTLGRWIGFLCSCSRLLVDPLWFFFFFFLELSLAQSGTAFCSEPSTTRGTRRTQLEWRSCSAELEATEREKIWTFDTKNDSNWAVIIWYSAGHKEQEQSYKWCYYQTRPLLTACDNDCMQSRTVVHAALMFTDGSETFKISLK